MNGCYYKSEFCNLRLPWVTGLCGLGSNLILWVMIESKQEMNLVFIIRIWLVTDLPFLKQTPNWLQVKHKQALQQDNKPPYPLFWQRWLLAVFCTPRLKPFKKEQIICLHLDTALFLAFCDILINSTKISERLKHWRAVVEDFSCHTPCRGGRRGSRGALLVWALLVFNKMGKRL